MVVDYGSSDGTGDVARAHGAAVVHEPERGYGAACLANDYAEDMAALVTPIISGTSDLVVGSRSWVDENAMPSRPNGSPATGWRPDSFA